MSLLIGIKTVLIGWIIGFNYSFFSNEETVFDKHFSKQNKKSV